MFLGMLSSDEKRAFARLARMLIEADGIVVEAEETALAVLEGEMGLATGEQSDEQDVTRLAESFGSRRAKVAAILELIGLGYSDSRFSVDEKSLVTVVAHDMGLSAEDLGQVDAWVKGHVRHVEEAFRLMGE
jgi:hypothetical protein